MLFRSGNYSSLTFIQDMHSPGRDLTSTDKYIKTVKKMVHENRYASELIKSGRAYEYKYYFIMLDLGR